ncbi:MAG: hypothetical protein ISR77_40225 [Pirellulaceae bacterium]|nr:hypothetical protein [Pirellulaceae bacterium]
MWRNYCHQWHAGLLLLVFVWPASAICAIAAAPIDSPEAARAAMAEFLRRSGKSADQYIISCPGPSGLLTKTYVASVSEKGNFIPAPPPRYLILRDGGIVPLDFLDLEPLVIAYRKEGIAVSGDRKVETIARSLIRLGDVCGPVEISSVKDIPGYEKRPLDADLEAVVRAPWKFTDKEGNVYWICTTYTQNGGVVRRYKFVFGRGLIGNPVDVIQLGRAIGDVFYPE